MGQFSFRKVHLNIHLSPYTKNTDSYEWCKQYIILQYFFFKVSFALLLLFLERHAKFSPAGVAILQFVGDLLSCWRLGKI